VSGEYLSLGPQGAVALAARALAGVIWSQSLVPVTKQKVTYGISISSDDKQSRREHGALLRKGYAALVTHSLAYSLHTRMSEGLV
jgi:hypothetical protein